MFEKMIGVSPPQVGKGEGSKVANAKDFQETAASKSAYKNDFEKALKEKQHKADKKAEPDRKQTVAKKEEPKALKKDKKSSGGIKKKMTEVDEKMVSNGVASVESEVETPVKEEKPAQIQVSNTKGKPEDAAETLAAADGALKSLNDAMKALRDGDAEELQNRLSKLQQAGGEGEEASKALNPQSADAAAQTDESSIEAQLGAAVGLKPNAENQKANKDLLKKLEDAGKPETAPSAFEKNVLETLQKESSLSAGSDQSSRGDQQGLDQKDKGDLKSDLIGNQLHQSAGQSHSVFKNHLEPATAAASTQLDASQLEAKREENINEVMKQAQYLVKKGGGEVSVKMSPEGMGEVHLKVVLENGKLNVEMQTQDKNVKKLIEESLSELKSGLAAHRLSLEHVKIDTVNATNTDNNAQLQSNLNQNSEGRQQSLWQESFQQQQSLNQQNRQRTSQDASRSSGLSASAPAAPRSSAAQALRTYGGTKGAGLNRVA